MRQVLTSPDGGYYTTQPNEGGVFGKQGDFITSPEITQVFGELIGVWTIAEWLGQGRKRSGIQLMEVGPGKGTLMDDMLRVSGILKGRLFYGIFADIRGLSRRSEISRRSRRALRVFILWRRALRLEKCKSSFFAATRLWKKRISGIKAHANTSMLQLFGLKISDYYLRVSYTDLAVV